MLDGLEVMERKGAHHLLLDRLQPMAGREAIEQWAMRLEHFLAQDRADREASVEGVFRDFAAFTAETLAHAGAEVGEVR